MRTDPIHIARTETTRNGDLGRRASRAKAKAIAAELGLPLSPEYGLTLEQVAAKWAKVEAPAPKKRTVVTFTRAQLLAVRNALRSRHTPCTSRTLGRHTGIGWMVVRECCEHMVATGSVVAYRTRGSGTYLMKANVK